MVWHKEIARFRKDSRLVITQWILLALVARLIFKRTLHHWIKRIPHQVDRRTWCNIWSMDYPHSSSPLALSSTPFLTHLISWISEKEPPNQINQIINLGRNNIFIIIFPFSSLPPIFSRIISFCMHLFLSLLVCMTLFKVFIHWLITYFWKIKII